MKKLSRILLALACPFAFSQCAATRAIQGALEGKEVQAVFGDSGETAFLIKIPASK